LVEKKAILTKDNMTKRKWTGERTCYFCETDESIDHLLFQCPVAKCVWGIVALCLNTNQIPSNCNSYWEWAKIQSPGGILDHAFGLAAICWATWKARNRSCFEHKSIKHPAEVVIHACALMKHWTGLYKEFQAQMTAGIGVLLATASRLLAGQRRPLMLLPAPECPDDVQDGGDGSRASEWSKKEMLGAGLSSTSEEVATIACNFFWQQGLKLVARVGWG
jgi:hypothetical protein